MKTKKNKTLDTLQSILFLLICVVTSVYGQYRAYGQLSEKISGLPTIGFWEIYEMNLILYLIIFGAMIFYSTIIAAIMRIDTPESSAN